MKQFKFLLFLGMIAFCTSGLFAKGMYVGFGVGLQFNMFSLSGTIMKDGLDSAVGKSDGTGAEQPGNDQQIIMHEQELQGLDDATGDMLFKTKRGGGMNGLVLNVFVEKAIMENFFIRVDLDYTKVVMGGHTYQEFVGWKWYEHRFFGEVLALPAYFGVKANVGENAAVYGGLGVALWRAKWGVNLKNMGDVLAAVSPSLSGRGLHTVTDSNGQPKGGSVQSDAIEFRTGNEIGFVGLIGIEGKISGDNRLFFELAYRMMGAHSKSDPPSTTAGSEHLAPQVTYPVAPAGTAFRFGYKIAM